MEDKEQLIKTILIIEDDNDLRDLYVEVLRGENFGVIEASDGETGMARAKEEVYDLLLLDIMLPKIDGLQILRSVKTDDRKTGVPVILLTNLGRESIIKEGFTLGADGYIIKSEYTPDQVVAEVKRFLNLI